jgi:DNA-directed RNA polymerase subunit H (RpoH/RPB5)
MSEVYLFTGNAFQKFRFHHHRQVPNQNKVKKKSKKYLKGRYKVKNEQIQKMKIYKN